MEIALGAKLDETNGVAFGTLHVYQEEVPGGHVGAGHALLDNKGLRFTTTTTAPDITYSLNGISALYAGGNEQWYYFDNTTNGIARLKDVPVIPTITTNGVDVAVTSDNKINIAIPDVPIRSIKTNGTEVAITEGVVDISIPDAPIKSVTTNGTEFSVREGVVTIPLDEYVKLKDLQDGITFDNLSATNLTVNGKQESVEGHKHGVSDITNLVPVTISTISTNGVAIPPDESRNVEISMPAPLAGLWEIPGAEAAANTAIQKIDTAQNMNEVKAALKEFLENFKKPTP